MEATSKQINKFRVSLKNQYVDKEVYSLLEKELYRQETEINLIASENYTSPDILHTVSSVMTNKYAANYPKRCYAGCVFVDEVEQLAIERCKKLFGAQHANVQPHAGSQANMAVYFSVLKPGDTILGMGLAEGGHLTHGHKINFSGRLYNCVPYKVNPETEQLDYDEIAQLAEIHKPRLIIAGASAYSRIIDFEKFAQIAKNNNAFLVADIAHIAGLVAAQLHPNPSAHADFVTSTTHKTLRGPRGGLIMCKEKYKEQIDQAVMPGIQAGPFMHAVAAKAVAFYEALQPEFKTYQKQIIKNAQKMAETLKNLGYRIVAGGTDNHLFVVDLRAKNITGHDAQTALEKAGITVSKSCIPFDTAKPFITSGIRVGTPAITARGMKEAHIIEIAHLMDEIIKNSDNDTQLHYIKKHVQKLCQQYPIY